MSDANGTPITGTTDSAPAPAAAEAAPSPAAAESTAPAAESEGEFLADTKESKPEAKAEGEEKKSEPDKDKDFLDAEAENDDAEKDADAPGDAKKEGEPEPYQPFTLPDGMELDDKALAKATPIFRKLNLDQDGAQELVSLQAEIMKETVEGYHQTLAEGHANTLKSWESELKAMPEYKGQALTEAKGRVRQVLAQLGTPELRKLLGDGREGYGLVRNPHVFKFLDTLAAKLSEDSLVREDANAPAKGPPMRDADVLYS